MEGGGTGGGGAGAKRPLSNNSVTSRLRDLRHGGGGTGGGGGQRDHCQITQSPDDCGTQCKRRGRGEVESDVMGLGFRGQWKDVL